MSEVAAKDRLYPSLLDRLTDEEPSKRSEPVDARMASMSRLRESVLQDLNWLFNATQMDVDSDEYPEIAKSVLNFGLPALSGCPASSLKLVELTRALRDMLLNFEPRLIPGSVRVHAETMDEMSHNVIVFRIEGQLWSQPMPIEIYMRTDIDLESGQTRVVESKPS